MISCLYRFSTAVLLTVASPLLAQSVASYQTTSDLTHKLEPQPRVAFRSAASPVQPRELTITVDETQRFQMMDGFGASITDGAAWLLEKHLTPAKRDAVMTQLFDPKRGIGLSFLRQPIGASDLSRDQTSFDDMPQGQRDPEMKHFSVAHDDSYIFPAIRQALKLNPAITVMATPWSPPAWMKTGDTMDGGQLREDAMPAYAAYLTRSIEAFAARGVPVKFLTIQNEPLNETYNSPGTLLPAAQASGFIGKFLGPNLQRAGLTTKVLAYDHNWDHPEYPLTILSDPQAAPFVAGSALHCYGGDVSAQNEIHRQFPDKGIWMTECSGGTWDRETPLVKTAQLLIESSRDWARAVVLWGLVLDSDHSPHTGGCGTCRALVTLDLKQSPAGISYTGDYYGLGHASKFVHPGATRIDSNSFGKTGLQTVAFQNRDGSIVLLVLNNQDSRAEFRISWHGREFKTSLSSGALATYVWPARS